MAGQKPSHPYHILKPSPWPLLGAVSGGVFALGAVRYMHYGESIIFWIGIGLILLTMFCWWRDVIKESLNDEHSEVAQIGLRMGMILFILSEVMFFVAFFWAFFAAALYPAGGEWPPKGIETIDAFDLPYLNTLLLLTSGTTVTWAHHAVMENDRKGLRDGLALSVFLGIIFIILQGAEYMHAPFGLQDGIFASTFYIATGFHGFHVMVGTIFLLVCLLRVLRGQITAKKHIGFESAAWYWHFVDVVWLFLFFGIYCWGS